MNHRLLAQTVRIGGFEFVGPLKNINTLADVINIVLPFIMSLAGIILFLIIILGGYDVMMAQGKAEKLKAGRAKITAGIIGFLLLILSYFLTKFISSVFNVGQGTI